VPSLIITSEQRAKIMAGSDTIDLPEPSPASGTAAAPAAVPAIVAPVAPVVAAAPAAPVVAAAAKDPVTVMAEALSASERRVGELTIQVQTVKNENAEALAALPGLLTIARSSVGRMQVALGGTDTSAALAAKDVVSEYARIAPEFDKKLPVGGIASTETTTTTAAKPEDLLFLQRLNAVNAGSK
jgi:hypothetical protein